VVDEAVRQYFETTYVALGIVPHGKRLNSPNRLRTRHSTGDPFLPWRRNVSLALQP
jgi:hypothetical protein